jgi:hypothetical protein
MDKRHEWIRDCMTLNTLAHVKIGLPPVVSLGGDSSKDSRPKLDHSTDGKKGKVGTHR